MFQPTKLNIVLKCDPDQPIHTSFFSEKWREYIRNPWIQQGVDFLDRLTNVYEYIDMKDGKGYFSVVLYEKQLCTTCTRTYRCKGAHSSEKRLVCIGCKKDCFPYALCDECSKPIVQSNHYTSYYTCKGCRVDLRLHNKGVIDSIREKEWVDEVNIVS